jgi:diaminohydroxyphosphoribosylaminopyrimidine deaminase/5-amino-6-(5-phosphoribosylamino)uracil reductase
VNDELFMRRALELAAHGRYSTSPNPMVGCVIVRDDQIIGEGFHRRAGEPHAEIEALRNCRNPLGATLYVTLEPCAHQGRTPPCSEAIIESRVARVVVAMRDPHDVVDGRGIRSIEKAGISVTTGICEAEARKLNERFVWSVTKKLPFVLLKAAMTLDGKLATVSRDSQWITAGAARGRSLELREEYDAIAIGSGTLAADNPRLTRRLGLNDSVTPWTRVVIDASGNVSPEANLFTDGERTILFTPHALELPPNVEVIEVEPAARGPRPAEKENASPAGRGLPAAGPSDARIDLEFVLHALHERGVQSLIVEGGSLLHSDFIRRGLWQKMVVFVAPAIVGGAEAPSIFSGEPVSRLTDAYRFSFDRAEMIGSDLMVVGYRLSVVDN